MKVAIAQTNPKLGDVRRNKTVLLEALHQSVAKTPDLIVFPELALTGYPPRDLLDNPALIDANRKALEELAQAAYKLMPETQVILGYIDLNPKTTGKPFYNAAAWLGNGQVRGKYFKRLLPFYNVFEDERYFEPGKESQIWQMPKGRVGVSICEDGWNETGFVPRLYETDPMADFSPQNCDLVVNLSASPFHLNKVEKRIELFSYQAKKCGVPIVFCNQVGAEDDLIFEGGSFGVRPNGEWLAWGGVFHSSLTVFETQQTQAITEVSERSWDEASWLAAALKMGIRDYVAKTGNRKAIVGLSGGIDSAVVCCLAVEALGAENVIAVSMPSLFSSPETRKDAQQLAKVLGIAFHEIPISSLHEEMKNVLAPYLEKTPSELIDQNIQPRMRMAILMAMSQQAGALVLNTSNKSELACGYATMYGDMIGALGVLGDLTKRQVYLIAEKINSVLSIIPETTLSRPPSAELASGQKDSDSLPPYEVLDEIVQDVVEKGLHRSQVRKKFSAHAELVDKFFKLYSVSEFKRHQICPILRVSARSFGRGRRIPIAASLEPDY